MVKRTSLSASLLSVVMMAASALADRHEKNEHAAGETPKEAVAVIQPTPEYKAQGVVVFREHDTFVHISGQIDGLKPGKHGFHIHQYGDLRAEDGTSAGGHYNPTKLKHGSPKDHKHHAGDLGNILADESGKATIDIKSEDFKVHFIIGRSVVVHAGEDDLKSQPSGDAGPRAGIGVIGFANVEKKQPETTAADKE